MSSLIGALGRALPKGGLARHAVLLAGGTATAQVLMFLSMPILTRLYTPTEMGVLSAFVATLSLVAVVGGFGYEQAIPMPADDADAAHLLVLSVVLNVGLALVACVGVVVAGDAIVRWTSTPGLAPYLWLLPVSMIMLSLHQNLNYWAIRRKAFTSVAKAKLGQAIGQVVAQVGLGALHLGGAGLLAGDVIGRTCGAGTNLALGWARSGGTFPAIRPAGLARMAWRYRKFTMGIIPAVMSTLNTQAPIFIVAATYGPSSMAKYTLAQTAIATPLGLVGDAICQAFLGEVAQEPDPATVRARLRRLMAHMAAAGTALGVAVVIGAPAFFALVFGETWREAGVLVQILVPVFVIRFALCPLDVVVRVAERQEVIVLREIVRSVILAIAMVMAMREPGGLYALMATLSAALVVGYAIYGLIGWRAIGRLGHAPLGGRPGAAEGEGL